MSKKDPVEVILIETHRVIQEVVNATINNLSDSTLFYPPNAALSESEIKELGSLQLTHIAKEALQKVLLNMCSIPIFQMMTLMDGVADPEMQDYGFWPGLSFGKKKENEDMLHDKFYETYHKYVELKMRKLK